MPVVMYELGIIDSPQEELNKLHVKKKTPWQKENCYRAASSRWWVDSVVAGPGRGSQQRVSPGGEPPAAGDAEPNPHP